jgi:hypothetical protein
MGEGNRIEIGYKIVAQADYPEDKKYSGYISDPELCVTYMVGKFARANHSAEQLGFGLTYFETALIAELYMRDKSYRELWECEVKGGMKLPPYRFDTFLSFHTRGVILNLLVEIRNLETPRPHHLPWPSGTKMCRQIKLTRRIEA